MNTFLPPRPSWRWPLSVADELLIDGLDEATRDAVERYASDRVDAAVALVLEAEELDDFDDEAYDEGYSDGFREGRRTERDRAGSRAKKPAPRTPEPAPLKDSVAGIATREKP